jgi:small subunit ribosomal protein S16
MIRFQRIGRRNDPAFRILVLEKTSGPKAGTYVDHIGSYNPKTKNFSIVEDRLKHWMSVGAQVSPSLFNLLVNKKILEGKKINVLPKKAPIVSEEAKAAAAAAEAAKNAPAPAPVEAPAETVVEVSEAEAAEVVAEAEEAPAEEVAEVSVEETPTEAPVEEAKEETVAA